METILTIDFDIIMWPSIELYNNMITSNDDKMIPMQQMIPLINYANADLELYYKITNYLLNQKDKGTEIIFIDSHEEILNYIKSETNVINIDHHHDLGYNDSQWDNSSPECGNWAYLGIKKNLIKKYIWLHGNIANLWNIPKKYTLKNQNNISEGNALDINYKHLITPSKIVICKSFNWIPINYRYLHALWYILLKGEK